MLFYQLLKQKYKYQTLEEKELNRINELLSKSKIRFNLGNNKKVNLKNKKNNFNIILNKLTDSNYMEILENEIVNNNINLSNILNLIYLLMDKIENEGKFSECYSNTIIDIDRLLSKIENKHEFIIHNIISERFYEILEENDEYKKENFTKFIYLLIEKGYFYKNLVNKIMEDIINKNDIYMIYLWLNINPQLKKKYVDIINEKLQYLKKINNIRMITLFETLLTFKQIKKEKKEKKETNIVNKSMVICENIIKEYMIIEDVEEVKLFIEETKINNVKDLLIDGIIKELFVNEDENFIKLVNLIETGIFDLQILKKKLENLSNDDIFIDYKNRLKCINDIKL